MRSVKVAAKKPIPSWSPNRIVRVTNIDPPTYFAPRAKPKASLGQRVKDFWIGQNGVLRRDLFNWSKNRVKK